MSTQAQRRGFTLTEIMIVVAIISLLSILAVPSWFTARERTLTAHCINNLRQLSGAKDQFQLERNNQVPTAMSDMAPEYVKRIPVCPAGGTYQFAFPNLNPLCTVAGTHVLPQ